MDYDIDTILCGSKGFTLSSPDGSLWVTKIPGQKNYSMCYKDSKDNCYIKIGIIKDVDALRKFFRITEVTYDEQVSTIR